MTRFSYKIVEPELAQMSADMLRKAASGRSDLGIGLKLQLDDSHRVNCAYWQISDGATPKGLGRQRLVRMLRHGRSPPEVILDREFDERPGMTLAPPPAVLHGFKCRL